MSADRYTRCPHCKATFKVSEEQLSVANGRVRCGACMNIFDAIAYSVSINESGQLDPDTPTEASVELEDSLGESDLHPDTDDALLAEFDTERLADDDSDLNALRDHVDHTDTHELSDDATDTTSQAIYEDPLDDELIQDDPDVDMEDDSSAMLSDEFLNLDEETHDPYRTQVQDIEDGDAPPPADESWTQSILDELDEPAATAQPASAPQRDAGPALQADLSDRSDHFARDDAQVGAFGSDYAEPPAGKGDSEPAQFFYQQDKRDGMHWFTRSLLTLVCIVLLLALIVQASWFHYEKLAKYPQVAKLFELACEHLQCTLPKLEDLSKITSRNLVVRSHPTVRQALIIDTVITNEAAFAQAFPNIALYFSDINNKTIAQRLIRPQEYLSADILAWPAMPPQEAIHISLELADPGKEAVNYQLKFFSAETEDGAAKTN